METIFESLTQTAARLNDTADAANALLREANERLATIGAGVSYTVRRFALRQELFSRYDEDSDLQVDAGHDLHVLCYGKIYGTWQIGIQIQHYKPGTSGIADDYDLVGAEEEPVLNADRELRIKAASMLPDFLRAYTEHLAKLSDELK